MANSQTLTNYIPLIHKAMHKVARELVGFIPSVTLNTGSERASASTQVKSLRTTPATLSTSRTPAMTIPATDDNTMVAETLTLDSVAGSNIPLLGESELALAQGGENNTGADRIAEMLRTVVNKVELDLAAAAKVGSSRGFGTAGTTPFGSNIGGIAQVMKILKDNGAPTQDGNLSLVIDTAAGANLASLNQLQKVNEAGTDDLLRQGIISRLGGFNIRESAQIAAHTKGTGTGFDAAAEEPAGEVTLAVDGGDSGTILAGDIITVAGDTVNNYVVASATASGGTSGNIVLNRPGLQAVLADTTEITIGNSYTPNIALHRHAIELAVRPPAEPEGGDAANDSYLLTDPISGMTFEFRLYKGYGMNRLEVYIRYGIKVWNPHLIATLIG